MKMEWRAWIKGGRPASDVVVLRLGGGAFAPSSGRDAGDALECAVERGFGFVTDVGRDARDAVFALAQAIGGSWMRQLVT
jgi:hypothetical protein